jgi:hypothetical protein
MTSAFILYVRLINGCHGQQTYGYEFLFTLVNLEKLGMVRRREVKWLDSGSPFAAQRRWRHF